MSKKAKFSKTCEIATSFYFQLFQLSEDTHTSYRQIFYTDKYSMSLRCKYCSKSPQSHNKLKMFGSMCTESIITMVALDHTDDDKANGLMPLDQILQKTHFLLKKGTESNTCHR